MDRSERFPLYAHTTERIYPKNAEISSDIDGRVFDLKKSEVLRRELDYEKKFRQKVESLVEARKSQDRRKEALLCFELAKGYLRGKFNINNLTNIEALRLRLLAERELNRWEREDILMQEGKLDNNTAIKNPAIEAAWLWLQELYGITDEIVQKFTSHYLYIPAEDRLYEFYDGQKAHDRYMALLRSGFNEGVITYKQPDSAFEEYIRKIRAAAHWPEADI